MVWLIKLLTELSSRKWISHIAGRIAKSGISKYFIPYFIKMYGINYEEAEKAVEEYASLNDFFTRRLGPDKRVICTDPDQLVSPVDAVITSMGTIESGQLVNVKGQDYTIENLLNQSPRAMNYRSGFYFVLYLSPKDYHRIHAPITGKVVERERIPGRLYPVHSFALRNIRQVLSRNERLITFIQHHHGEIAVVKVGAMNVGSIQYVDSKQNELKRGDELAYFEFGSTVVLLTEKTTFNPDSSLQIGQAVKMGESLGTVTQK